MATVQLLLWIFFPTWYRSKMLFLRMWYTINTACGPEVGFSDYWVFEFRDETGKCIGYVG